MRLAIVALFALLLPSAAQAQGTLIPFVPQTFYDANGDPCSGCKLYTYAAGTTTAQATYSDVTLSTANANPVVMNAGGRPSTGYIFLSATSYKFTLTSSADVTIWTVDNATSVPTTSGNTDIESQTAGEALAAGDCAYLSDGSGSLTSGRWYQCDADNTYESSTAAMIGIATTAIASGASGTIRTGGRITGLSGLTAGSRYYASATAGALTTTPPTNARLVGQGITTTTLAILVDPGVLRVPDSDGTHSLVLRTSQNQTQDLTLTLVPSADTSRTVTISGDATISQDYSTTASPTFVGTNISALASTAGGSMVLLRANSGTDTNAAATNVDTIAITGLTAKDTLIVYVTVAAVTQQVATAGISYNSTDGVNVASSPTIAAGVSGQYIHTARQSQAGATTVLGSNTGATSAPAGVNEINVRTFTTNWTGSWTLALRHGGVTAGGTLQWSWAVYKVKGQ